MFNMFRDKAIPPLNTASSKSTSADQDSLELNRLSIIVGNQIKQEKLGADQIRDQNANTYPNLRTEAQAPPPASEFQTARLFLSHLGYIAPQVSCIKIITSASFIVSLLEINNYFCVSQTVCRYPAKSLLKKLFPLIQHILISYLSLRHWILRVTELMTRFIYFM